MSVTNVPFFPYNRFFVSQETEFTKAITNVLKRGAFIMQQELADFEKNIREYIGSKHCLGLANCTDALIIALRAAGVKPGDEVIISSHTFIATAAAAHYVGAIPVPVECGPDHMIDAKAVEAAITPRTTCIMPTQLNGRTCDMDAITAIAKKHKLLIVEDSAQGLGSRFKGKMAGTFGVIGTYSFYPAKILGCFGDGGALVTNDDAIADEVFAVRDHGRGRDGQVTRWGLNSRLDNVQAAVLNLQFGDYQKIIDRRRAIASLYQTSLGDLEQLTLPPAPDADKNHYDTYQNYEIEADNRDGLKDYLKSQEIGTLIQWGGKAVHQFKELGFTQKLPFTEKLFERCLLLPMNALITDDEVAYVASKVREFYKA